LLSRGREGIGGTVKTGNSKPRANSAERSFEKVGRKIRVNIRRNKKLSQINNKEKKGA